MLDFRLDSEFDIVFCSGALHYVPQKLRKEILENYQKHTADGGLHALNVFVRKPFVKSPSDEKEFRHKWISGELFTLGDEIFTPDSSRFWALDDYRLGVSPKSYDKQFVRDWLIEHELNGVTPAPELPDEIINITSEIYKECCRRITGKFLLD